MEKTSPQNCREKLRALARTCFSFLNGKPAFSTHAFPFLLIVVALLPTLLLRDFTPANELRYLSIADEALRNHTFFAFTNHGVPYADKPPLYFWAIMFCKWLTGRHLMWLLALFSLLPALGTVYVMERWAGEAESPALRRTSSLMLLTTGFFLGAALTLRMDAWMTFFIVCAMRDFWSIFTQSAAARRSRLLFPVHLFLAVFTKGSLGLLIPLCATMTFLVFTRNLKSVCRFWGLRTWLPLLGACGLWFLAVRWEGGSDYLNNLLFHQTVGRAVHSFHHRNGFYYYLLHYWYVVAPWSLWALCGVFHSLRDRKHAGSLEQFFLLTTLSTFVLLSVVSSKLQIYFLPAIPFLIHCSALSLSRRGESAVLQLSLAIPAALFLLVFPAWLGVMTWGAWEEGKNLWLGLDALTLSLTGAFALRNLYLKERGTTLCCRVMAMGILASVFFGGAAFSSLNRFIGFGAVCETAKEMARERHVARCVALGISHAENMDVYLGDAFRGTFSNETELRKEAPCLVLTRTSFLPQFRGYETKTVGDFAVVVIPAATDER
ncbi:MAG: ArnT family glycosyltransferase [Alloprevotella sp.]